MNGVRINYKIGVGLSGLSWEQIEKSEEMANNKDMISDITTD